MSSLSSLPLDINNDQGNPKRFVAGIQPVNEGELATKNVLWINSRDLKEYFAGTSLARIQNNIFEVHSADWLTPGHVGMSKEQNEQVYDAVSRDGQVLVTPFQTTEKNTRKAYKAFFAIHVPGELNESERANMDRRTLHLGDLDKRVSSIIVGKILKEGQTFSFVYRGQTLRASYIRGLSIETTDNHDAFDLIGETTDLVFKTFQNSPLRILQERCPTEEHTLKFSVTVDSDQVGQLVQPALISQLDVASALREAIGESMVAVGDSFMVELPERVKALVVLKSVEDMELDRMQADVVYPETDLRHGYKLSRMSKIEFEATSHTVAISEGPPTPLKQVKLIIMSISENDGYDGIQEKEVNWINIEKLRDELLREISFCGRSECFVNYGMYVLKLKVLSVPSEEILDKNHWVVKAWKITPETTIDFAIKPSLLRILVPNETPYAVRSLEVFIKPLNGAMSTGVLTVDREKLTAALRERKIPWSFRQEFEVELDEEHSVGVRVESVNFVDPRRNGTTYPCLGKVDELTVFEFDSNERFIRFSSGAKASSKVDFKNLGKELEDRVGLTSLSEEVMETVKCMVYPLTGMRRWAELTNIKPPKGLLLYGPPGTGKTTLARGIQHLLGIPEDNLIMVSAPSLHSKWVGESEENIRNLFAPARDNPDKLHMIVLDEIDSIVGSRGKATNSYVKNLPTQLLAEMDGLHEMNNVIVVGTTNRLEDVDEAFLRDGRFSHQLHFPKPNAAQRLKILDFQLKKLREKGLLAEDVDIEFYAKELDGASGDHLRGLVVKAVNASFSRLAPLDLEDEDYGSHPEAKIKHEDFMKAVEAFKNLKGDGDQGPPPFMFT